MKSVNIRKMVLTAMFIAIGLVLPFITGQNPTLARILSPMHIPIFICGMVCGWQYGLIAGIITPLLRSVLFGMPAMMPNAVGMAFELGAYGAVIGLVYAVFKRKGILGIYLSLIIAMLAGRIVWGLVSIATYRIAGAEYGFSIFIAKGFVNQVPGTISSLIIVPLVMIAIIKSGLLNDTK
ncbi:MAG: ECF transporter S component [Lachnospiraceae bacterium]|nr:ECF transporter S component [Lachnospiraceae bacterium]